MNKLYSVHDHWTDINKKNDVDIESIDGVITGIKVNGKDYGGSITWESVYSGSIDPDGVVSPFTADISLTMTATDLIKVVYDGVEYVLPKQVFNEKIYYGAVPASLPADIDFTNYPFLIQVLPNIIRVYTETAGLHTLAISVPQSGGGGSSDFSTAKMTVINNKTATTVDDVQCNNCPVVVVEYNELGGGFSVNANSQIVFDVILYKGHAHIYEMVTDVPNNIPVNLETEVSLSGGAVLNDGIDITGDCTITIS